MEKPKTRVCHVTSVHNRYDVRIFQKECKSLSNNGYDVILLVNDELDDEIIDKVTIISTGYKPKNRYDRMVKAIRIIKSKALSIDADIYHLHDPELLPLAIKIKKLGKKVIFDSHEYYYEQIKVKQYIPKIFRSGVANMYYVYETYVLKNIDSVIFPCTIGGENPFINRAKKTVLINNVPIYNKLNNYYHDRDNERIICYTGGLTHNRGITNIIRAAYKAGVTLDIAGKFISKNYHNELKKMKEYSVVNYKGYLGRSEIYDLYNDANIGMCTLLNVGQYNKVDNLPTKAYEYMSVGLPVIISESDYANSLIDKNRFGVTVNPDEIEEITKAISFIIDNPEIGKKMGQEGMKLIKEKFNWTYEEKKLIELYDTIINN